MWVYPIKPRAITSVELLGCYDRRMTRILDTKIKGITGVWEDLVEETLMNLDSVSKIKVQIIPIIGKSSLTPDKSIEIMAQEIIFPL